MLKTALEEHKLVLGIQLGCLRRRQFRSGRNIDLTTERFFSAQTSYIKRFFFVKPFWDFNRGENNFAQIFNFWLTKNNFNLNSNNSRSRRENNGLNLMVFLCHFWKKTIISDDGWEKILIKFIMFGFFHFNFVIFLVFVRFLFGSSLVEDIRWI